MAGTDSCGNSGMNSREQRLKNYIVTKCPETNCVVGVSDKGGFYLLIYDGDSSTPSVFGLFRSAESRQSMVEKLLTERRRRLEKFKSEREAESCIVSVTVSGWVMRALEKRRQLDELMEILRFFTVEQLELCVMSCEHDAPGEAAAYFFLQLIAKRDRKAAIETYRKWKKKS